MTVSSLPQYLSVQATERPEALALVGIGQQLTYGQLERQSNSLACCLQAAGCQPGDRVALLLSKSPLAIVCMFAALKAGCIYVPMDVDSPRSRLDMILEGSGSRFLLANQQSAVLAGKLLHESGASAQLGWLGEGQLPPAEAGLTPAFTWSVAEADAPPAYQGKAQDIAHLLFTSGSTGKPKGVAITHSNVIHFVDWAVKHFQYSPDDRISSHPPLHFDLSTLDVYGTLAVGAELHLVPAQFNLLPHKVAEFIRERALTQWFSVPSLLSYLAKFDVVRPGDFPTLKRLLWCGERFPTPALRYWMQRLPHVQFTNLYGPTEATIASSFYRVPECPRSDDEEIPIGTACAGEALLVLDHQLQTPPPGEQGDLYISGVGLSPGYWNDQIKTKAVFLEEPFGPGSERIYKTGDLASIGSDGLVYLHGRSDSQIKSRGYRIELGEIEAALQTTRGVQEAAVVAIEDQGFEGATICCAFVPESGLALDPPALRQLLAERLPKYMLPARWSVFETLPLNGNGKIDKPALRQHFSASSLS